MANITAKINVPTSSGPQKVSVTIPSNTLANSANFKLKLLGDVDATSLVEGSILQYRESDQKFVARNVIDTPLGQLRLSGGNF